MSNRRNNLRINEFVGDPFRAEVKLPSGVSREVNLGNLGPDGAFLECGAPVEFGEEVTLSFSLPNHAIPFALAAEVRWRKGAQGFGVQFRPMASFDRAGLEDFCQKKLDDARRAVG